MEWLFDFIIFNNLVSLFNSKFYFIASYELFKQTSCRGHNLGIPENLYSFILQSIKVNTEWKKNRVISTRIGSLLINEAKCGTFVENTVLESLTDKQK